MNWSVVGSVSLNVSFILYLIHYFPQLIHNQRDGQLPQLSLSFHYLLIVCYLADLNYGFGLNLPWQYRLVSVIGVACLVIQHLQLARLYKQSRAFRLFSVGLLCLLALSVFACCVSMTHSYYVFMGYAAHGIGLFFLVPQIVKNSRQDSAFSLSLGFLTLDWLCYFCDNVSAWALAWPQPSKIGSAVGLVCISLLLVQWRVLSVKNAQGRRFEACNVKG